MCYRLWETPMQGRAEEEGKGKGRLLAQCRSDTGERMKGRDPSVWSKKAWARLMGSLHLPLEESLIPQQWACEGLSAVLHCWPLAAWGQCGLSANPLEDPELRLCNTWAPCSKFFRRCSICALSWSPHTHLVQSSQSLLQVFYNLQSTKGEMGLK